MAKAPQKSMTSSKLDSAPRTPKVKKHYAVPMERVVLFVQYLEKHGLTDAFLKDVKKANAFVVLSRVHANLVENHLPVQKKSKPDKKPKAKIAVTAAPDHNVVDPCPTGWDDCRLRD